jgi:hypothetical protein
MNNAGTDTYACYLCQGDTDPDPFGELDTGEPETDGEKAEVQMERRVDFICRELIEFAAMANNTETVDLIEGQAIGLGQIQFRAQLILSFLQARAIPKLKMVQNNGR